MRRRARRRERARCRVDRVSEPLECLERALLCVGPVRELGDRVQQAGQHPDRCLVVLHRRRVLLAADGDRPKHAREHLPRRGPCTASVEIEVVAVRAQDTRERVGRILDVDLHARRGGARGTRERNLFDATPSTDPPAACRSRSRDPAVARPPWHYVVIVVAREEHEPLALEPLAQEGEQAVSRIERVLRACEQEVEHVAEKDHLVDVEMGLEQGKVLRLAQDVLAGPCAEMGVGDHQGAHRAALPALVGPLRRRLAEQSDQFAGFSAWPPNCLRIADSTWLAK